MTSANSKNKSTYAHRHTYMQQDTRSYPYKEVKWNSIGEKNHNQNETEVAQQVSLCSGMQKPRSLVPSTVLESQTLSQE